MAFSRFQHWEPVMCSACFTNLSCLLKLSSSASDSVCVIVPTMLLPDLRLAPDFHSNCVNRYFSIYISLSEHFNVRHNVTSNIVSLFNLPSGSLSREGGPLRNALIHTYVMNFNRNYIIYGHRIHILLNWHQFAGTYSNI